MNAPLVDRLRVATNGVAKQISQTADGSVWAEVNITALDEPFPG